MKELDLTLKPVYVYLTQTEALIEMGSKLGGELRLQVLQAARVFGGNESRPDRAEDSLCVHGAGLAVRRLLCDSACSQLA